MLILSLHLFQISVDVEHAKCSICLNIWHDVVTVAPCLHNFWLFNITSNGCFSEWLTSSQQKKSRVICPQCRGLVQFVGRNHFLHNIVEKSHVTMGHEMKARSFGLMVAMAIKVRRKRQICDDGNSGRPKQRKESYLDLRHIRCLESTGLTHNSNSFPKDFGLSGWLKLTMEGQDFGCELGDSLEEKMTAKGLKRGIGMKVRMGLGMFIGPSPLQQKVGTKGRTSAENGGTKGRTVRIKKKCPSPILLSEHQLGYNPLDMLRADSSLGRSKEEIAVLDSYSTIKSNLVIGTGRANHRKRSHTAVNEDEHGVELRCPQCVTEYGGFCCNSTTVHLQCQACGGMMPSRTDISVPQHCKFMTSDSVMVLNEVGLGCDRPFCCAYWHAQRVTASDLHPMCSSETFKPIATEISEHRVTGLPFQTHESNRHEQEITDRCISQSGRTLQEVISDWIVKLNNREIDRARMPLNHAETITATTHICRDCYDKLVSFLLYWFRISLPKYLLPPDASKREDCWYGYACRTQHHNEEHARKRNHVCRPTRGSH
ncbi:E3 ubiquitin-protein ligase CHFR, cysteine rich domain with multizinc binding, partial [Dillenia turbinata]